MSQQQQPEQKKTEEVNINSTEYAWKAVGSPSRRGSVATALYDNNKLVSPNESPKHEEVIAEQRRGSLSENPNWGSFGGFQWEGPSIFDQQQETDQASHPYEDILSVPMLPGVSLEPIYRQQRSLSFSMGQEPTFFGYDDYEDQPVNKFKFGNNMQPPIMEEEDEYFDEDIDFIRSRSKSSGAAFGLLSKQQYSNLLNNHVRRGSEQQEDLMINQQRRRSSSRFFNLEPQQLSMGDKDLLRNNSEYSFPNNNNNNNARRPSLSNNVQQLTDQLENTHINQQYLYLQQQQYLYMQQQQQMQQHQQHQQQQQQQQQNQVVIDDYFDSDQKSYQELGKGIPISRLDPKLPLYMVEFKAGRTDFFYVLDSNQFHPQIGDLVIVEGDRGKDLGKVFANTLSLTQVQKLEQKKQLQLQQLEQQEEQPNKPVREMHIKRIFRLANADEINLLLLKGQDEHKSLMVSQQKTKQRKLPMEVVDAEYQWDRRKLTFYFQAENRIDFRELVRELFKIYKTRIWMCVVTTPLTMDDIYAAEEEDESKDGSTAD